MQNKCWCGQYRNHGGNKKLAAAHSKIAQKKLAEEREKLEKLNGKPEKKERDVLPFRLIFKSNGIIKKSEFC